MKSSEDDREIEEKANIEEENVRNVEEHDKSQNTEEESVRPRRNRQVPSYLEDYEVEYGCLALLKGAAYGLIAELRLSSPELFFNQTRMSAATFDHLSLCGPYLQKNSPREAIDPSTRLLLTLRFLATGIPTLV
nr:unnamed protein product [Callosobruchus analis]